MADEIKYIGLNKLEKPEQIMVNTLVAEYYPKIKRLLHNETSLVLHIKPHKKGGKRERFEITLRASAPTKLFEVGKTEDWDLARAIHKTFKDMITQIEHHFKQN